MLLIIFGVLYGAVSLGQVLTGRGLWLRRPTVPPSPEKVRAGGWVGVAIACLAVLLGVNQLVPTASAFVTTAVLLALGFGGTWAVVHRWQRTGHVS